MTRIYKDTHNNWKAADTIRLVANRVLEITTHKVYDGTVVTTASVHIIEDSGFMTHRVYNDFSQRLMTTRVRCTEKAVAAQHAEAMTKKHEILEAVTAWYAAKGETAST